LHFFHDHLRRAKQKAPKSRGKRTELAPMVLPVTANCRKVWKIETEAGHVLEINTVKIGRKIVTARSRSVEIAMTACRGRAGSMRDWRCGERARAGDTLNRHCPGLWRKR
jgi:hypothetical protein